MEFKARLKVLGVKRFNDEIEGNRYDFTKVFIEMDLDESTGNAVGKATEMFQVGTSSDYDRLSKLSMPFEIDAVVALVTNGKTQKQTIKSYSLVK